MHQNVSTDERLERVPHSPGHLSEAVLCDSRWFGGTIDKQDSKMSPNTGTFIPGQWDEGHAALLLRDQFPMQIAH